MSNFSSISWREQVTFSEIVIVALYKTNTLNWIVIVLAHWNNRPLVDMSFHLDTLSRFRAKPSLHLILKAVCSAGKQHIPS